MPAVLLLLLLATTGCALRSPGAAPAGPASTEAVLQVPLSALWQALPAVYDSLALPVTFADSAATRLATVYAVDLWLPVLGPPRAPYARCSVPALQRTAAAVVRRGPALAGVSVRVPPGRVMLTVETALSPAGTGTRITTRLRASPVELDTGPEPTAPYCVSTGRLEALIQRELRARVETLAPNLPA